MSYYKKAFTLIELLVVISLLGILSALTIPISKVVYINYQEKLFINDCLRFEQSFKERINYFSTAHMGTTEMTKSKVIAYPLKSSHKQQDGDPLEDNVEPEKIENFMFEVLYYSSFKDLSYTTTHQKAEFNQSNQLVGTAYFNLYFENQMRIELILKVNNTYSGGYDYAKIQKVIIIKDSQTHEFEN